MTHVHKQWRVEVILDVLAHEESRIKDLVDLANREFRDRLNREGLAPGVNIARIEHSATISVAYSGTTAAFPDLIELVEYWCKLSTEIREALAVSDLNQERPKLLIRHLVEDVIRFGPLFGEP